MLRDTNRASDDDAPNSANNLFSARSADASTVQEEISLRRNSTIFRSTVILRLVFAFAEQFALELIGERHCFKDDK